MLAREKILFIIIMTSSFVFLFLASASASSEILTETVAKWNHKLDIWNRYYYISLFVVIIVAALGAISGILQKAASSKLKTAAIFCAYAITVITVIVNAVAIMDYKEIKKAVDSAERKISQLNMLIEKSRLKENDASYQMAIIDQAQILIGELHDIQAKVNLSSIRNIEFISTALAGPPAWVAGAPHASLSDGSLNFVGQGQDRDLSTAKEKARDSFISQVGRYILDNIDAVVKTGKIAEAKQSDVIHSARNRHIELAKKITANLREQDAYFEEVQEDNRPSYKYYLLYRVSPGRLNEALQLQISIFE